MKNTRYTALICLFSLIALMASACASVSSMQTPGVVPQGEVRWAISSSGAGGAGNNTESDSPSKISTSADPNFEASVRYGAAENFDIGLKINFAGAQISGKYQFMKGDFDLALGLEAGYQYIRTNGTDTPDTHVIELQVPLLMEYHFNPYVGLAFGPKFLGIYAIDSDNSAVYKSGCDSNDCRDDIWGISGLYTGIMIGMPLRLTEGIWFMPEINVYGNAYDSNEDSFTHVLWQAGVSVFFGGL